MLEIIIYTLCIVVVVVEFAAFAWMFYQDYKDFH